MTPQELDEFINQDSDEKITNVYIAASWFNDALRPVLQNKKDPLFVGKQKETLLRLLNQSANMVNELGKNAPKANIEREYQRTETNFIRIIKMLTALGPMEHEVVLKLVERVVYAQGSDRKWTIHLQEIYDEINKDIENDKQVWQARRDILLKAATS